MPMFFVRATETRVIIIHNSCLITSTAKESGFMVEAVKNCFSSFLRELWREINMPRFFEIIIIFWSRAPCIIPTLILVHNGLVILLLGGITVVLICWHVTEWPNIFALFFGFSGLVFPYLDE